jgi:hypothetical protein
MSDNRSISLAEFLETIPPGQARTVDAQVRATQVQRAEGDVFRLEIDWPEIQVHCTHTNCNGMRFFEPSDESMSIYVNDKPCEEFVRYTCRNCREITKLFAILAEATAAKDEGVKIAFSKIGEDPAFGPPTPSRLITLIGPDREIFIKGRRAENHGLGIGAFAYYRRVIENQKGRILEQITEVAQRIGASSEIIDILNAAKTETQFLRVIELIKDGIPDTLKIKGANPLTLLHSALSEGLHAQTDEECLELAQDIRLVLSELAERISRALKDDHELDEAVGRLLKRRRS